MNGEYVRIWTGMVFVDFQGLYRDSDGRTEENYEKPNQYDLNQ
jgi:hypothetical protein